MPHDDDKSPPLVVKAKNLMGAIGRAAGRVLRGESIEATQEDADYRDEICSACPDDRNRDGECLDCGCEIALKILGASEFCPLGHWGQVRGEPRKGIVRGKDVLEHEVELREVLPPDGRTVRIFNQYHERMNAKLRCKSCEKTHLLRKLEVALSHDIRFSSVDDVEYIRDILPNKTQVMLETVRSWDDILNDKKETPSDGDAE
jgi:hypothetical protein